MLKYTKFKLKQIKGKTWSLQYKPALFTPNQQTKFAEKGKSTYISDPLRKNIDET